MQETQVQSLDLEDPLEKGMDTYSSIATWRINGQRSLTDYSPCGHRVRHNWVTNTFATERSISLSWFVIFFLWLYERVVMYFIEQWALRNEASSLTPHCGFPPDVVVFDSVNILRGTEKKKCIELDIFSVLLCKIVWCKIIPQAFSSHMQGGQWEKS